MSDFIEKREQVIIVVALGDNSWSDDVSTVIDVASGLLAVGGFLFPEVKPYADGIAKVGGVIKEIIGKLDPKPDPVMGKLVILEHKMDELAYQMNAHFDDMKAYITEVEFLTHITVPTTNLMRFMQDCMRHPTQAALDNFKKSYENRNPLTIAYDMLSFLDHEKTNPLKMAMLADPLRTTVTFEKWEKKIGCALGQFLFLELFASGLFKEGKDQSFDASVLIERSNELYRTMEGWKNAYKVDLAFWHNLQKILEDELVKKPDFNVNQKTDLMEGILKQPMTEYALCLMVSPGTGGEYVFQSRDPSTVIQFSPTDHFHVFIYRHRKMTREDEDIFIRLASGAEFDFKQWGPRFNIGEFLESFWYRNRIAGFIHFNWGDVQARCVNETSKFIYHHYIPEYDGTPDSEFYAGIV